MRSGLCLAVLVVACRQPEGASVTSATATTPKTEPSVSASSPRPVESAPASSASSADHGPPIDGCASIVPRKVGVRASAPLATTLSFEGGALAVCVDSALYPYAPEKGHRLFTTFRARVGSDVETYRGEGQTQLVFHGYRIEIGLEKASHTGSSEVWLEVDRAGADTKL